MSQILKRIVPQRMFRAALLVGFGCSAMLSLLMLGARLLPKDSVAIYGLTVFCGLPFAVGVLTPLALGVHNKVSFRQSFGYSLLALSVVAVGLTVTALEGLICIVMTMPIAALFALLGVTLGYARHKSNRARQMDIFHSFAAFLLLFPLLSFAESRTESKETLTAVTTSVEINASPEKVWKNVVEFSELPPPDEMLFQTGVAYPIRAEIKGEGVGAVRYCIFSTGAFVEPIEVWRENELLAFSVREQPLPMREISPYGSLDTPHLHDYFVSRQGQFKLTRLADGRTLLEGTTWYFHRIKPEIYWRIWTEQIIHKIHQRVLRHIKAESEK